MPKLASRAADTRCCQETAALKISISGASILAADRRRRCNGGAVTEATTKTVGVEIVVLLSEMRKESSRVGCGVKWPQGEVTCQLPATDALPHNKPHKFKIVCFHQLKRPGKLFTFFLYHFSSPENWYTSPNSLRRPVLILPLRTIGTMDITSPSRDSFLLSPSAPNQRPISLSSSAASTLSSRPRPAAASSQLHRHKRGSLRENHTVGGVIHSLRPTHGMIPVRTTSSTETHVKEILRTATFHSVVVPEETTIPVFAACMDHDHVC